jgi:hypothetical protein
VKCDLVLLEETDVTTEADKIVRECFIEPPPMKQTSYFEHPGADKESQMGLWGELWDRKGTRARSRERIIGMPEHTKRDEKVLQAHDELVFDDTTGDWINETKLISQKGPFKKVSRKLKY